MLLMILVLRTYFFLALNMYSWEYLVENECRQGYEEATDLYELALRNFFLNDDKAKNIEDLYTILKNIRDSTLEKYSKITAPVEKSQYAAHYKEQLRDFIDNKEQAALSINEEMGQASNTELLQKLSKVIQDNLQNGVYGPNNIEDFQEDFNQ